MNTYEYSYNGVVGHTFTGTFAQLKKHVLEKAPENAKKFMVRNQKGGQTYYTIKRKVILSAEKTPTCSLDRGICSNQYGLEIFTGCSSTDLCENKR